MSTITKEQLIRRAHLTVSRGARELEMHPNRDGVAADIKIASIAARSLMAEPIYQLWDEGYYDTEKETYYAALKAGGRGRIVYTAPPAPANAEPVAWLWSHRKHPSEVTLVRPEDDEKAEASLWSGWSCQALYAELPTSTPIKDHQIRELVNELRDIAIEYHGTQQLRERIARTVRAAMLQGTDGNSPTVPEWHAEAEKMAELHGISFVVFRNGESPKCADPSKVIISFTDEGIGHGSAAPQQEVKP